MDKVLFQKQVAELFAVSEETITAWENGRNSPMVHHYPAIILFLEYYPFIHETDTIAGKLKRVIFCKGWSHAQCAKALGIDTSTVKRILKGQRTFTDKSKDIELLWSQLPEHLTNPYRQY